MVRNGVRVVVALVAVSAAGCNTDAPNPFVPPARTRPIPADAALIFTSNAYTTAPGAPREVFTARADGSGVERLTFCNTEQQACDTIEAAAAPDRRRIVMRRVTAAVAGGLARGSAADERA